MLFLMETKADHVRMELLRVKLKFSRKLVVNSCGNSGGLCLFWNANVKVVLLSFSVAHIDVSIESSGNKEWRLTGFYGNPEGSQRNHSWNLLRRLEGMSLLPWACVGDFNEVLCGSEKLDGLPSDWKCLAEFREALDDSGLVDLGYLGSHFTWSNKREGEALIFERLDRCTGSLAWKRLFPRAAVYHLDFWRSDHRPILLDLMDQSRDDIEGSRRRRFFFEECWIDNNECRDLISKEWVDSRGLTVVDGVLSNLRICGSRLDSWNVQCRRRLKEVIVNKKMELHNAYNNIEKGSWRKIQLIEAQLDGALAVEERYWKQRSRVDWLKCGDRNTSFFHMKATVRKARNKMGCGWAVV